LGLEKKNPPLAGFFVPATFPIRIISLRAISVKGEADQIRSPWQGKARDHVQSPDVRV